MHTNPSHLKRSDLAIPINRVGTGVYNALAMLYVALTAQTQRFLLLEEPNPFLHPCALRELLAILAEIGGKHQFFITTHSSDVLRTIKASTVTLLEYDGQQTTITQTTGDKLHAARACACRHAQRLTQLATTAYGGTQILRFEGFEAWWRAKFETELDIREKIKWISGGQVIGSRIQGKVMADQIMTADKRRLTQMLGKLTQADLGAVERVIRLQLGLQ